MEVIMGQVVGRPKARPRLSMVASAQATIAGFGRGGALVGLTYGQFSLVDLVEAILGLTGPADVLVASWSVGFHEVDHLSRMVADGRVTGVRLVVDSSEKIGQATPADVDAVLGRGTVRATRTHAKFVVVSNAEWAVTVTTSMNLNKNPRCEHFEMVDDRARARFFLDYADELWVELAEGHTEDRALPVLTGLDAVEPVPAVRAAPLGSVSVGVSRE